VNDWKVIPTIVITTVLIFGAGVFTGGMLVDYVKQARPHPAAQHAKPSGPANSQASTNAASQFLLHQPPQGLNKDFLQRLDDELHLTKDEHEAVLKIINEGQNQMRKVLQDSRLEIREVLTAEQRDQFDQLIKRPYRKPIFNTNNPSSTPPPAAPPAPSSTTP
jgi:hypothetical protein